MSKQSRARRHHFRQRHRPLLGPNFYNSTKLISTFNFKELTSPQRRKEKGKEKRETTDCISLTTVNNREILRLLNNNPKMKYCNVSQRELNSKKRQN
ncbi:hypothetical protein AVEN_183107-1 [Araneus ventricosus]|uniref:Uncharacterized protein n=1 Tax=Araneus ventricosus TaxID=182803 RepID=A0A4Y2KRX1_ARAVE|nr:hypothetical protein AVEN_183107-1 [Araneus ventricosus]